MAFVKKTWKDRISQYPNRRTINDGFQTKIVTVGRSEGSVTEAGDSFNAENMNDLEDRINEAFTNIVHMPRVNDKVPYQYRQTPVKADRCIEKLIGVSCAFNQLVQNGNFADSSHWEVYNSSNTSLSVANNESTLTMLASGTGYAYGFRTTDIIFCTSGHKFIVFADLKVSKTGTYAFDIDGSANGKQFTINTANTYTPIGIMFVGEGVSGKRILIEPFNNTLAVGDTIKVKNVMLIDLTSCFGSEVADYLYTLESNTAGSGIALFKQLFPDSYYAYQTATLISSKPVAKKVVGINQWDEGWEVGRINTTTGENQSANDRIRSKNYIPCFGSTQYYWKTPYNGVVFFYDSNNGYLGYQDFGGTSLSVSFTTPNNARFVRFFVSSSYGTSYGNNISINYPSTDHDYHAYEEHTYPLGSDEIRGLLKVEDGQLVAYGDIHPSDGNGTEVFDIVDLGSLDYSVVNGVFLSSTAVSGIKYSMVATDVCDWILCPLYTYDSPSNVYNKTTDMTIAVQQSTGKIFIYDSNYDNPVGFKAHLSGVYLLFEKATPTAKSYTPFTNPMLCGSTEEFTDSRSLKMFCGHDSLYEKDLIVPNTPTADGTYTLKCTVVSGEPTLNWQADT